MTDQSNRLQLGYIAPTGGDNHGSVNLNMDILEAAAWPEIISSRTTDVGLTPSNGDIHWIIATATDAFAGQEGKFAFYKNGWFFRAPREGMVACFKDRASTYWAWDGANSNWAALSEYRDTSAAHPLSKYDASGSQRYSKTVQFTANGSSGTKNIAHGISSINLARPVDLKATLVNSGGTKQWHVPYATSTFYINIEIDATNIILDQSAGLSGYTGEVQIEYTP